jgi:hypothetical protein
MSIRFLRVGFCAKAVQVSTKNPLQCYAEIVNCSVKSILPGYLRKTTAVYFAAGLDWKKYQIKLKGEKYDKNKRTQCNTFIAN